MSKGGDEYRLLLVQAQPLGAANPDGWHLYRQSNDGDGVTAQDSLTENLLHMVDIYFDIHP